MRLDKNFHLNKVSRFINTYGEEFEFKRNKLNDFNEVIDDEYEIIIVNGVYHEVNSQVTESNAESSVIRSKPQPRILCMPILSVKLKQGDITEYKGTKYKVVEPANPLKYDICVDISLEVVEVGK